MTSVDRFISRLLIFGALATTLVISPWNYDPIGVPKMSLIATIAVIGFSAHLLQAKTSGINSTSKVSWLEYSLIVLVALLTLNLIVNNYAFSERLFGLSGRHAGYITYISFAIIGFLASKYLIPGDTSRIIIVLYLGNLIVTAYYLLQRMGLDFIAITEYYARPSSTLGNPNFVSGFLGLTAAIPMIHYLKNRNKQTLLFSCLGIGLSIFIILDSQSIQGIFALAFTIFVIAGVLIFRSGIRRFSIFTIVGMILALASILGFLGKGPLATVLSTTTLFSRFDYWRTAIYMTRANPLTGVGLDGYGDFYREYRDQVAFNRFGESQTADTPHNVFLDYFASGGFPLGLAFLFIIAIVYVKALKRLIKAKEIELNLLALFAVFNGYLAQAFISPNQIGIGIWLWILVGGLWSISGFSSTEENQGNRSPKTAKGKNLTGKILGSLLAVTLPFHFTPLVKDASFLSSARSTDGLRLLKEVQGFPADTKRILLVEQAFKSGGFDQLAFQVAKIGIDHNPNSYLLWKAITDNSLASSTLRAQAENELRRLEPRFESISK